MPEAGSQLPTDVRRECRVSGPRKDAAARGCGSVRTAGRCGMGRTQPLDWTGPTRDRVLPLHAVSQRHRDQTTALLLITSNTHTYCTVESRQRELQIETIL